MCVCLGVGLHGAPSPLLPRRLCPGVGTCLTIRAMAIPLALRLHLMGAMTAQWEGSVK